MTHKGKGWLSVKEAATLEGKSARTIQLAIKKGLIPAIEVPARGRGGKKFQIHINSLSPSQGSPSFQLTQEIPPPPQAQPSPGLSEDALLDPKISQKIQIVKYAMNPPPGYTLAQSKKAAALKYGKTPRTVDTYCRKYKTEGPQGFIRHRSNRGEPRTWDKEAIDFWLGLCLKRPHNKLGKAALYEGLCIEAAKPENNWRIGSYTSALWWYNKRATPQLEAIQRGGVRALDNTLPPVVRDYSDLPPFDILVGDQHRCDFWVMDDETGEIFRPEGYYWQDLRTRLFYGGAIAKKYDSSLMGLSLRMGMRVFGPFGSIYTDNGRPECGRYIMSILKEMRALGLEARQTEDLVVKLEEEDPEELRCLITMPGTHIKAIVRNAKAKMIEGTFKERDRILRSEFRVPGHVKDIKASQEEQHIVEEEIRRLAAQGKLLTFREFALADLKAMDFYNACKGHRGILREWAWKPKPKMATPMDCLRQCYFTGEWQPTRISEQLTDLVFLRRATRTVDRGRITLNAISYEAATEVGARELTTLTGERVSIRYDPLDTGHILVFREGGEFVTECRPTEYSSMRDKELALHKIGQKRRLRQQFIEQYRELTSKIPDFLRYSGTPLAERAAAIVSGKRKRQALLEAERLRPMTQEELDAELERRERYEEESRRHPVFRTDFERLHFLIDRQARGQDVTEDEAAFVVQMEAGMGEEDRAYWGSYREEIGGGSR